MTNVGSSHIPIDLTLETNLTPDEIDRFVRERTDDDALVTAAAQELENFPSTSGTS